MAVTFDHTRIRVSNLEESIDWYCKTCGFQVLKRTEKSPSGNQLAHLQIPGSAHKLELTHSPDYELKVSEDLVHTCIRVDDIFAYCEMQIGREISSKSELKKGAILFCTKKVCGSLVLL